MRKHTVRNGMRLIMVALILIVLASFYHLQIADLFLLSPSAENRFYRLGIFWAAAIGGYGVLLATIGLILSPDKNDAKIRLLPIIVSISAMVFLFFYLFSSAIESPPKGDQRRLHPDETITI